MWQLVTLSKVDFFFLTIYMNGINLLTNMCRKLNQV